MHSSILKRIGPPGLSLSAMVLVLSACSIPSKLSADQLASMGIREGVPYWVVQGQLAQKDYRCYVSGAKREHFDCARQTGFFPSCLLRVTFDANEQNAVTKLRVADPACIGTP